MKTSRIPDDVYEGATELAQADNVSVERLVEVIVNEQAGAWSRLKARAARGSLDKVDQVLLRVSDVAPEAADQC